MLQETRDLLRIYEPGQTSAQLSEAALAQNVFPRMTARRAHNVVAEMFAPRYLTEGGRRATELQFLLRKGLYPDDFNQLCFLHTARAQAIFGEFIAQVIGPRSCKVRLSSNAPSRRNLSSVVWTRVACKSAGRPRPSSASPPMC